MTRRLVLSARILQCPVTIPDEAIFKDGKIISRAEDSEYEAQESAKQNEKKVAIQKRKRAGEEKRPESSKWARKGETPTKEAAIESSRGTPEENLFMQNLPSSNNSSPDLTNQNSSLYFVLSKNKVMKDIVKDSLDKIVQQK